MAREMCETCEREEGAREHPCPYQVEMRMSDDEYEVLCNCCYDCYSNCAGDI